MSVLVMSMEGPSIETTTPWSRLPLNLSVVCRSLDVPEISQGIYKIKAIFIITLRLSAFFTVLTVAVTLQKQWWTKLLKP